MIRVMRQVVKKLNIASHQMDLHHEVMRKNPKTQKSQSLDYNNIKEN